MYVSGVLIGLEGMDDGLSAFVSRGVNRSEA